MSELVTPQSGSPVDQLFPYLENPNVRNFLGMIGSAEGTDKHGYNTLFGGGKMDSLADHPRILFDFTETTGRPNKTTAAGRYQFLTTTWDEQAKKLGLRDFGPQSQDLAAINLLRERGILPDVLAGNWEAAVKKSGPIWASLPSSQYPQPRQSNEFVMSKLNQNNMVANATTSDANPVALKGLSGLSNEELLKLAGGASGGTPSAAPSGGATGLQGLSDEQLMALSQGQPAAAPTEQKPMDWQTTLATSASNLPSSAMKFGKELYEAVTNPVETAKSIGMVAAGGLKNITPEFIQKFITSIAKEPGQIDQAVQMANAVGGEYAQKYGSVEGFKKALATDPVSVIGDMSILLTGGGSVAAKVPGIARAGEIAATAGRAIDPLNLATKAVTKPLQLAEMLATPALGSSTGAGAESIREAAKAGAAGGTKAEAFLDQLRGNAPISNVVKTAKDAVGELYQNRSDAYLSGMGNATASKQILDFAPIDAAITKAEKIGTFEGIEIRGNAANALKEIKDKIQEFKNNPSPKTKTIEGFDKLKQAIGDIQQNLQYGSPARKVADELYNAVKNEIVKQAPEYGKVMADYESASALLKEIQGTLSQNPKANVDTSIRKLQSVLRNNANTNYGRRVELARELEATGVPGADTLFPQLAGQMLSAKLPRGIQGGVLPGLAGSAAYYGGLNPATIATIGASVAASSPRLVGEAAYYGGKAYGTSKMLADALKNYSNKMPIDPYTLRMLATKLGQQQTEEQR
jgi:muramidase (phage lysozyme)